VVERLALYHLLTCIGQKSLSFAPEVLVDNVCHDSIQDGISQELQALIVECTTLLCTHRRGFVEQGLLVIGYFARIKSEDFIQCKIRRLILEEKEPYSL
jgi:hypothetical protein